MTLRITQKAILAVLLFVTCIAVLGAMYIRDAREQLLIAEREQHGMSIYTQTLGLMTANRLNQLGAIARRVDLDAPLAEDTASELHTLQFLLRHYRTHTKTQQPQLRRIFKDIEQASGNVAAGKLASMLRLLSEDSRVLLDPLSASAHLATIISGNIPLHVQHAETSLQLLDAMANDIGTADGRFLLQADNIERDTHEMAASIEAVYGARDITDVDHAYLANKLEIHSAATAAFVTALRSVNPDITLPEFDALITSMRSSLLSMQEVHQACVTTLRKLLDKRNEQQKIKVAKVLSATLAGLLLSCAMYWLVSRSVLRPLFRLKDRIYAMANWELEAEVPGRERRDEIGEMAFAVDVLRQNARRFKEIEDADALYEAKRRVRQEKLEALVHDFEHRVLPVIENVFESAGALHHTAERMKQSVMVAQRNAGQVHESVGSSSQQIETIAESSDTIHRSITDMVQKIQESVSMTQGALEETKGADQSTQELATATRQISGVIALIRKITEKINLLALNAGIESIRAGEAGKGFVVVAQEVKTLATQTKRATEDIVDKILFLQEKTTSTENALRSVHDGMSVLTESNQNLHHGIREQQKLTNSISYSMHQASGIMHAMDSSVGTINTKIAEIDTASREVVDSARSLGSNANILTHEIKKFLREISAVDSAPEEAAMMPEENEPQAA